jgi:hypothetical protein
VSLDSGAPAAADHDVTAPLADEPALAIALIN